MFYYFNIHTFVALSSKSERQRSEAGAFIVAGRPAAGAFIVASLLSVQVEQAVSDLQRGGAVRDGERVLPEETLALWEVRATPPTKGNVRRV